MTESGGRPRIAVVNDDTAFLDLMYDLLQGEEHYEVLLCKESAQVHQFIKEHQPDLVILDLMMGRDEQGWQTLELLKLDPQTTHIPIIICSAAVNALEQNMPLLEKYGVEVLPKPFNLDDLLAKIKELFVRFPPRGGQPSEG